MGRPGRKRRTNRPRYKNGNFRTPTALKRGMIASELVKLEKAVVLAQPHRRRGKCGDEDQLLECPLGRLIVRHKLDRAHFAAAIQWGVEIRRWLAVKGVPVEIHAGGRVSSLPTDKTVQRWTNELERVEIALKKISLHGFLALKTLAVSEREITAELEQEAIMVLKELAILTDYLPRNPHPFAACAAILA